MKRVHARRCRPGQRPAGSQPLPLRPRCIAAMRPRHAGAGSAHARPHLQALRDVERGQQRQAVGQRAGHQRAQHVAQAGGALRRQRARHARRRLPRVPALALDQQEQAARALRRTAQRVGMAGEGEVGQPAGCAWCAVGPPCCGSQACQGFPACAAWRCSLRCPAPSAALEPAPPAPCLRCCHRHRRRHRRHPWPQAAGSPAAQRWPRTVPGAGAMWRTAARRARARGTAPPAPPSSRPTAGRAGGCASVVGWQGRSDGTSGRLAEGMGHAGRQAVTQQPTPARAGAPDRKSVV